MPVNGFTVGKRLWVEILCGTVRVDFIGTVLYVTETKGQNYHIQFIGGFSLSCNEVDLVGGRVLAHEHPDSGRLADISREGG